MRGWSHEQRKKIFTRSQRTGGAAAGPGQARPGTVRGHAANTFGIAIFIWLTLRPIHKWTGLIFIWAMLMSYSRIYLGVHFPGDIAVGIAIGIGCGLMGFKASQYMRTRHNINNSPPVADDVSIN